MIFEINTKDEFFDTLINKVGLGANDIHNILDEFGYMIYENDFKITLKVPGEKSMVNVKPTSEVGEREEEERTEDINRLYFEFKEGEQTSKKEVLFSELEAMSWFEIVEYMFEFLKGCGFQLEGHEVYEKMKDALREGE